MSNLGAPISPTEQITFEIDRLLRISEADCGTNTRDHSGLHHQNNNNNNNVIITSTTNNEEDFFFEKTESVASSNVSNNSQLSTTTSSSNHNNHLSLSPPPSLIMMNVISPSFLQASGQVSIGVTCTPAAIVSNQNHNNNNNFKNTNQKISSASSTSSSTSSASSPSFNQAKNQQLKTGNEYFAALYQTANNAENTNDASLWSHVAFICDCLSDEIFTNNNKVLKREVIELVQKEFDTAFESTNKNIKRRHIALMLVAHLFAAPHHVISEKVFIGALYRALNNNNTNTHNNTTTTSTSEKPSSLSSSCSSPPPPLHVLLTIARALEVTSHHFDKAGLGMQHLPYFLGKLCNGLILTCPNESQHQELCDAIKNQSGVLHGFRGSSPNIKNTKLIEKKNNCFTPQFL